MVAEFATAIVPPLLTSGANVTTDVLTDGLMFCTVAVTTPLASVEMPATYFEATPPSQPQLFGSGAVPPD